MTEGRQGAGAARLLRSGWDMLSSGPWSMRTRSIRFSPLATWYDPFEHLLDHQSGDSKMTADQPGEYRFNGTYGPQDIVEFWCTEWSRNGECHERRREPDVRSGIRRVHRVLVSSSACH